MGRHTEIVWGGRQNMDDAIANVDKGLCLATYGGWQRGTARIRTQLPLWSINISCPPGPQQQTCSLSPCLDTQTYGVRTPYRFIDTAPNTDTISSLKQITDHGSMYTQDINQCWKCVSQRRSCLLSSEFRFCYCFEFNVQIVQTMNVFGFCHNFYSGRLHIQPRA